MGTAPGTTHPHGEQPNDAEQFFTTQTEGLPTAALPQLIRLRDGDRFDLRIEPVRSGMMFSFDVAPRSTEDREA